jgi:hypothetical protein
MKYRIWLTEVATNRKPTTKEYWLKHENSTETAGK